ncbi:MAG: FAD-linked oxidase C-terminal domain-containing protein [Candidatus Abyssubacteria bacterium]
MSIDPETRMKFRQILGENLFESVEKRIAYSSDASMVKGELPDLIARPTSTEQVSQILKLANSARIPVYSRGAGTNLTGGAAPLKGGIVLDFELMNAILNIDADNMTALVQPGVVTAELQKQVEKLGLFYPPDPASSDFCTIGGNVAENSGGLRGAKYGSTREYVMALEVVLADGEVLRVGTGAPKSVTGYDLVRLFVGSEGTLGVFTEILLKLVPLPEHVETVFANFPEAGQAASAVCAMFRSGIVPRAAELMDEQTLEALRRYQASELLPRAGVACLFEVDGPRAVTLEQAEHIVCICREHGATEALRAHSRDERDNFWSLRRAISPALYQLGRIKLNEDICVPRTRLAEMLDKTREIGERYSLRIVNFGHIGDGSIHFNVMLEREDPVLLEKAERAVGEVFRVAVSMGGTLSAEHGIGVTKARFLGTEVGAREMAAMARIKKAFDPNGILNPGKFADEFRA